MSSVWIWRKEIEWLSVAFTSLIGMLTRPNEMAPFHMDRTCGTLSIGFGILVTIYEGISGILIV
jgi:hypothetical protein